MAKASRFRDIRLAISEAFQCGELSDEAYAVGCSLFAHLAFLVTTSCIILL